MKKTETKKNSSRSKDLKALYRLLIKCAVIVLSVFLITHFVFGVYRLSGDNMSPALKDGDLCVTYKLDDYHAKDIVAYHAGGKLKFGRIIAHKNDTVDGDESGLILNNGRLTEDIYYPTIMTDTNLKLPVTLKEGEYLILNDYRIDMKDSRTYGIITEDMLEGKLIFIFRRRGF